MVAENRDLVRDLRALGFRPPAPAMFPAAYRAAWYREAAYLLDQLAAYMPPQDRPSFHALADRARGYARLLRVRGRR